MLCWPATVFSHCIVRAVGSAKLFLYVYDCGSLFCKDYLLIFLRTLRQTYFAAGSLLLAGLCFGIWYCLVMPPWEGGDEYAHYSYIEQIVCTGKIPTRTDAFISSRFYEYAAVAPVRLFDDASEEGLANAETYYSFFAGNSEAQAPACKYVHGRDWSTNAYAVSTYPNWQAQHPPLYYWITSFLLRWTEGLTLAEHMAALRLFSYLIAWVPLAFAAFYILGSLGNSRQSKDTVAGIAILFILSGGWYTTMARIGNDSLCVLFSTTAFLLLSSRITMQKALLIGIALGLGAITKGYFVAVWPLVALMIAIKGYREKNKAQQKKLYKSAVAIALTAVAVSGWWYFRNIAETGSLLGAWVEDENVPFIQQIKVIFFDRFNLFGMLKSGLGLFTSGIIPVTGSGIRPSTVYALAPAFLVLLFLTGWLKRQRSNAFYHDSWAPLWFLLPMAAGVLYHLFSFVYKTGSWGVGPGGAYFFSFALPLGIVLGGGFGMIARNAIGKWGVRLGLAYSFSFTVWTFWAQFLYFAGIARPTAEKALFSFPSGVPGSIGLLAAVKRLDCLAFPRIALVFFAGGILFASMGLVMTLLLFKREPASDGKPC